MLNLRLISGLESRGRITLRSFRRWSHSSVDKEEISKFATQASSWWDPTGPASMLHRMNPVRVAFIRSALELQNPVRNKRKPLEGLNILDVGCGVGILSEPLARLGANVLGCDASEASIHVAKQHRREPLTSLYYTTRTVEELMKDPRRFDCVIASEVIEHVNEPRQFLSDCVSLLSSNGTFILSTINRTVMSYLATKVLAEDLLRLLPEGTHDWQKYPTPEEVAGELSAISMSVDEVAGMVFNPITRDFHLSENTAVNYILRASRDRSASSE